MKKHLTHLNNSKLANQIANHFQHEQRLARDRDWDKKNVENIKSKFKHWFHWTIMPFLLALFKVKVLVDWYAINKSLKESPSITDDMFYIKFVVFFSLSLKTFSSQCMQGKSKKPQSYPNKLIFPTKKHSESI